MWHISRACIVSRGLREDGEGVLLLARTDVFPARHSALAAQREICAWAFSGKQQKNPFHFFQLESDARSCLL